MPAQPPSERESPATPAAPAAGAPRRPPLERFLAYHRFWLVAVVALGLDQLTKNLVAERLAFGGYGPEGRVEVIRGFFYLIHVGNTGAAWSMFSGRSTALALLAVGTLAAIFHWRRALGLTHRSVQPAFGLLCGGVVGNLIDRVQLGHVVDFLDFHFGNYVYPTFNVADSAILIGVGWYVLWSLRQPPEPSARA